MLNQTPSLLEALSRLSTVITAVTHEADSLTLDDGTVIEKLPAFTRVALESTPGPGSFIRHELWLPEVWNGRFVGTGNGGMAGKIVYSGLTAHVRAGYAVINTDLGTSRGRNAGIGNPDMHRDFGWRATKIMTEVGKCITEAHYGRPIEYAYFCGGSTGGQQAMAMAQRCPAAYDAISAGVPAHSRLGLHAYFLRGHRALKQPGAALSAEELTEVTRHAVAFARTVGMADGDEPFISRPYMTPELIDRFIAYLRKNCPSLSEEQLAALRTCYLGPINPRTGERIYTGLPLGAESRGSDTKMELLSWQKAECPRIYTFTWFFGEGYTGDTFDFDTDMDRLMAAMHADLDANDADLRPFFANGGKLFLYSGSADPIVPFPEAVRYYNRVIETVGGLDAALDGARYFLVPGQDHRANIPRFGGAVMNGEIKVQSVIEILRLWREEGAAPERFDITTVIGETRYPKTIHAYGMPENPCFTPLAADQTAE